MNDKTITRYAVANREIPAGSLVLVEKPFVSCLDVEKEEDHCHHCLNNCPLRQVICMNNDNNVKGKSTNKNRWKKYQKMKRHKKYPQTKR